VNIRALIIALAIAGVGATCLFMYIARFEAETSGGPKVPVLVATRDIKLGESLTQGMLGIRNLPQAYLEERHVRTGDMQAVLGAQVSSALRANEAVLWSDLATRRSAGRVLAGLILPGMRALTINAGSESVFSGLLRPGDRVDVFYSRAQGSGPLATAVLLQNLVVLAVGVDTGETRADRVSGTAITLSVTTEQAQLLTHARMSGKLGLVLRNSDDIVVNSKVPEVSSADIEDPERRQRFERRVDAAGVRREIQRVQ
jgi:pilus assembly protein CpaB